MNKQELLRKYIDRDLTPEEEQEALHIIADDPELRSLLRFEQQVKESFSRFPGSSGFDVPEHFADHVMSRIEAAEQPEPVKTISWQEKLEQWIEAIWMPRQIQLRPVYVAAALILLVTGITLPLSLMEQQQIMTPTDPGQSVQAVSEKVDQVL
ncbi:MAG: hypothetical protein R3211_11585, partial [Balneolaceae bacterium]|nr:hypothetical protein [Balneolaceae bacterium]